MTAAVLERPRRAHGTGSIQKNGNGYRWSRWRGNKNITGKTWPTYAEAEAELAKVIADPTFVPAPTDGRGKRGIRKTGRVVITPAEDPDLLLPDFTDAEIEAAERRTKRWGAADATGRRVCLPCAGKGVDRRPGPGAGRCCLNCGGEGAG